MLFENFDLPDKCLEIIKKILFIGNVTDQKTLLTFSFIDFYVSHGRKL